MFLPLYPAQFLLPNLSHFQAGHTPIGLCYVVFWLFTWTVPLLAASFNVRYDLERRVWIWVTMQGVIWTVVVLYILLVLALLFLTLFLHRNPTGLRWDPRSPADIMSLLAQSNATAAYNGSETFQRDDWIRLADPTDRIGYWCTSSRPDDIFYGIGKEGSLATASAFQHRHSREKASESRPQPAHTNEQASDFSKSKDLHSPEVRLKYLPWYLRDTMVIAWIVTAVVLLITFLVVSYINGNVRLGFLPQVKAHTNLAGFSASNFLYSFIPALIGHFLFLAILSLDQSLRVVQPYIALTAKGGAAADTSLLVDYACRLPLSGTVAAAKNKHLQTAMLSFVSFTSISIPILAGGCLWTQYYDDNDDVRVAADLPGYYALCFFLAFYTLGLFALLPNRSRAALPHASTSLAEMISWVYQSPILADCAFARSQTKRELVATLMGMKYLEAEQCEDPKKVKYGFGIYTGCDGCEHLGIDQTQRGRDSTEHELLIWGEQQQKRKLWTEHV